MHPRRLPPALLAAAATAAVIAGAAGYAGNHAGVDLAPSAAAALAVNGGSTTAVASTDDGTTVTVTTITPAQFASAATGLNPCASVDAVRMCQMISSSRSALPTWDVYADLGQVSDLGPGGVMDIQTRDQRGATGIPNASAVGPYVKLHWASSTIDITTGSSTLTTLAVSDQTYTLQCSATRTTASSWIGSCTLQHSS